MGDGVGAGIGGVGIGVGAVGAGVGALGAAVGAADLAPRRESMDGGMNNADELYA